MRRVTISGVISTSDSKTVVKSHPLMILTYLKPYMFILLIPAIQGTVDYIASRKLTTLIFGEMITAAIILALSVFKFLRCRMIIDGGKILVQEGILIQNTAVIPTEKISSIFIRTGPILLAFGAVEIRLNTEAGRPGKADFKMVMPRSVALVLYDIFPMEQGETLELETTAKRLIIMAAMTSNSATGLLIAAPVIDHAGKLLGAGITEKVYDTINVAVEYAENAMSNIIPPIAGYIAIALLIGFAVSFALSIFKNMPFKMKRRGDFITATAGTVMKRRISFKIKNVNSVSILKNPIMMLFGRCNVGISVAGYGDARGETASIIPATENKTVYSLVEKFFPHIKKPVLQIKHPKNTLRSFCIPPAVIMIAVPIAATMLSKLFIHFSDLIWFLAFVTEIFDLFFFIIAVLRYQRTGITVGEDFCVIGMRWFTIVEFHCKKETVGIIRITRFPWDKLSGLCRVKFTVRSENAENLNVALLEEKNVQMKLSELYGV